MAIICGYASSQTEPCLKAKWIAVKNDSLNNHLFDSNNTRIDSIQIFQEIKNLVELKKISLYNGDAGFKASSSGQHIDHELIVEYWNHEQDSAFQYDPYFEFSIQSDVPLVDEYGENVIHTDEDGAQYFVYAPPTIVQIDLGDIYELHILEELTLNEFEPTKVAFCIKKRGSIKEVFWINLKSTFKATGNETLKHWIKNIQDKNYSGFQFKQTQCNDEFNR